MEKTASTPQRRARRGIRWRWIVAIFLVIGVWRIAMAWSGQEPSVVLSDGIQVFYVGSSKGLMQPPGVNGSTAALPTYRHPSRARDSRLHRLWQDLLDTLPPWASSRLPAWEYHGDTYPAWVTRHECEVQLRVLGDFSGHQHQIFVVDEHGWETRVDECIQGDDGRYRRGAERQSGWIRLASAFPRRSQSMRVRFRRWQTGASPEELLTSYTDLELPNPFHEDTAPAKGGALPISKRFHDGTVTLKAIKRDAVVGSSYGTLLADILIHRVGLPLQGYLVRAFDITDSSGQHFDQNDVTFAYRDGHCFIRTDCAPWSDDPCWHLKMVLSRDDYFPSATESEKFRFENLPVPGNSAITLDREITKNGITLRIRELGALAAGGACYTVEGWPQKDPQNRRILIHDARDDRGRAYFITSEGEKSRLVHSVAAHSADGHTFAVDLPPRAKSWNLTLLPETISTVEFDVRPPPVK